ncbi:DMT family transporter [Stygiobacter electus]|jgi:drug/metabolite transporter (DMT)-like permease|uniref:DMT family transporter n=1 Tax=Stygiobacter electus TaxID=3032292 RepID=A0AAE3NZ02_9BACT|nr:DMT family transporter [Stygiobacter electus]MDF1612651.1 DMT family transporter [Stygiobacter electus]
MFGELAALITAFLWSMTSIVFSEASRKVGSVYVNVTRMIFAFIYLSTTLIISQVSFNLSTIQIIYLVISGFIGLVFGDTFLFNAYRLIGARLSMLVMSSSPAFAALLAFIFLGEKISFIGILGIIITIAGISLVVLQREERPTSKYKVDWNGIFYALLGSIGQAVGLIFAKFAFNIGEINGFVATFVRISAALILILPMTIFTNRYAHPIIIFKENKKGLLFTLIGSFIGPYLGITFSLISISHTKIGIASTIMATVPILMLPMVYFYYKEKLSWVSILGAFLAVGGVALLFLF